MCAKVGAGRDEDDAFHTESSHLVLFLLFLLFYVSNVSSVLLHVSNAPLKFLVYLS